MCRHSLSEVAQQLKSLYSTQLGAAVKVHPNSGAVPAGMLMIRDDQRRVDNRTNQQPIAIYWQQICYYHSWADMVINFTS